MERRNQTVVGMARSMMKAKSMLVRFWGEAVTTTVFILNHAPTKALKGKTPFEAWYGRKPSVSFLRTISCIGHVRKTKPILTKLEDRSTPMVFLGYAEGTKGTGSTIHVETRYLSCTMSCSMRRRPGTGTV